jgi:hypothetical protein
MVFWFAKQLPVDETLSAIDVEKDVQNSRYNDVKKPYIVRLFYYLLLPATL